LVVSASSALSNTFEYIRQAKKTKEWERFWDNYSKYAPNKVASYGAITSSADNSPMHSILEYGRNQSESFYYLDDPTDEGLWTLATKTPLGKRLTIAFSEDIYNNDFVLEFPKQNEKLDPAVISEINSEIRQHLKEIGFYDEAQLCCAFDLIHGESLLYIYREGDGALMYEQINNSDPKYQAFAAPPRLNGDILRVQAINRLDYQIPTQGAFGDPENYLINFYSKTNNVSSYTIHPNRVIRWRTNNINYNQYKGHGNLHACYTHLHIISEIDHAAASAARRWGIGLPAIFTKGIRGDKAASQFKQKVGDPTKNKWFIVPSEQVSDIRLLGIQGTMIDLAGLEAMIIDQISAVSGIPQPILMGEVAGVVEGSEVNERQYFAALDRQHTKQNQFIRQFFKIDPYIQRVFKKYGISDFEINWGLRQVLTKIEQAELDMRTYTNATTMMNFSTLREVRQKAGLPNLESDESELDEATCQRLYGISRKEVNNLIANLGMWKQQHTGELLESPVEQREEKREEEQHEEALAANNTENSAKVTQSAFEKTQSKRQKEAERRAIKVQKRQQDRQKIMDLALGQEKALNMRELPAAPEMKNMVTHEMYAEYEKLLKDLSKYEISEQANVHRDHLVKLDKLLTSIRNKNYIPKRKRSSKK